MEYEEDSSSGREIRTRESTEELPAGEKLRQYVWDLTETPKPTITSHDSDTNTEEPFFHGTFPTPEAMAEYFLHHVVGLDLASPHARKTPERFVKMLRELTTPEKFEFTTFPSTSDEMIIVRNIPFTSSCSHHIIPFIGMAHIGYVPNYLIAGLSKFARAVRFFSRQLQVQEELTNDIANFLEEQLDPMGVAVVMEAEHLCMTVRGAQSPGTKTYTAAMRGVFSDHTKTAKAEFLGRINGG